MVARPVGVLVGLLGTRTLWPTRSMVGWFGVRGAGSLYYLMFASSMVSPKSWRWI